MTTELAKQELLTPELREAQSVAERLLAMKVITTAEEAEWVNSVGHGSSGAIKTLTALHKDPCEKAHAAHRAAVALRDGLLRPFEEAKKRAAALLGVWNAKLDAERRQRQAEAEAAAKKLADDLKLAEAEALERAGDHVTAAAVMEAPAPAIHVVAPAAAPKPSGFSGRIYYRAEVVDLMQLAKDVVAEKVPLKSIQANQSYLDDQAGEYKDLFESTFGAGVKLKKTTGGSFR